MKKISCAERIFRSAQDLYKKRAAAGFNPAAAFMRSRLSEINQRLTAGSTGGIVSSSAGTSGMAGIISLLMSFERIPEEDLEVKAIAEQPTAQTISQTAITPTSQSTDKTAGQKAITSAKQMTDQIAGRTAIAPAGQTTDQAKGATLTENK